MQFQGVVVVVVNVDGGIDLNYVTIIYILFSDIKMI